MAQKFDGGVFERLADIQSASPFPPRTPEAQFWELIELTREGFGLSFIQATDVLYKVIGQYVVLNEMQRTKEANADGATV